MSSVYYPYKMADVRLASAQARFNVVSMFAGGGGSSVGYGLAGGEVLLANEFVPEAARTYRANFPDTFVDERDIRQITSSYASVAAFLGQVGLRPGEVDILDGSVPCNEFSTVGPGVRDPRRLVKYSDVQQRGSAMLIFDFARLVRFAMPKIFIIENVPAMKFAEDLFDNAMRELRFLGGHRQLYFVKHDDLLAADFGVPQRRKRLHIIGVRADEVAIAADIRDDAGVEVFPEPTHAGAHVNLRAAFDGVPQSEEDVYPWWRAMTTSGLGRHVRKLPRNPDECIGPEDMSTRYTLKRLSWNEPMPTITAAAQQPDGRAGLVLPDEDRKPSVPELMRGSSFPDDYILTGTLGQKVERIGNAVPPLLTMAVADSIYRRVLRPYAGFAPRPPIGGVNASAFTETA